MTTYRDNDKPEDKPILIKNGPNFDEMWWKVECGHCESIFKYKLIHTYYNNGSQCVKCPQCTKTNYHHRDSNRVEEEQK